MAEKREGELLDISEPSPALDRVGVERRRRGHVADVLGQLSTARPPRGRVFRRRDLHDFPMRAGPAVQSRRASSCGGRCQ